MTKILGVILAGGRGKRLGGAVKANLEIDGISLIDRMVNALSPQCDSLVLSIGQFDHGIISSTQKLPEIPDPNGVDAGPVGGLAAGVLWGRALSEPPQYILTAAVDTPFFPTDFTSRALSIFSDEVDCVMGKEGQQAFPTNSLWRFSSISNLPERTLSKNAPHGLRAILKADVTKHLTYPALDPKGCFLNVNTHDDLALCASLSAKI